MQHEMLCYDFNVKNRELTNTIGSQNYYSD